MTVRVVRFYFNLRLDERVEEDEHGLDCADVHEAYLIACRTIPALAASFQARGRDPSRLSMEISLKDGTPVMDVPFDEVLRPHATRSTGVIMPRSRRAMISAAHKYRLAFADAPFGAMIVTPDLAYVSVNRAATELIGESDETTHGLTMESDEIRARDPGDTLPRAIASAAMARDSRRAVQAPAMFWGRTRATAITPPLTISYWPLIEDDVVVALGIRIDAVPGVA